MVLFAAGVLRESQTPIREISEAVGVPDDFAAVVLEAFPEERCTSATSAMSDLQRRLDRGGYADWSIQVESGVQRDACVSWSINSSLKTLTLVAALAPEVRELLRQISDDLMDTCFGEQDAVDYVTSVLTRHGLVDLEVRTDGGLAVPLDRADEVLRHVGAGCWVFSGTGWKDGHPLFFVGGE